MGGGSGPNRGGGRSGGGSMYSGRNATRSSAQPRGGGRGGRGGGRGGAGGPKRKEDVSGGGKFGGGFNPTGPPAGGAPAARGGHRGGGVVGITTFGKEKEEKADSNLHHVGAVAMESVHHDLLFGLIQEHNDDKNDAGEMDAEEAGKTERRLVKMGFSAKQVGEAMDDVGESEFDAVLDHLILHTPEHLLPSAYKEKKQPEPREVLQAQRQQRQQPGTTKQPSSFLPQPVILKPGEKVWEADPAEAQHQQTSRSGAAGGGGARSGGVVGVVKPLTGAEEKKVLNLMAFGFERLECIDALKTTVGDPQKALLVLLGKLYPNVDDGPAGGGFEVDEDELEDMKFDERTAVESMYGEESFREIWFQIGHIVGCEITMEIRGIKGPVKLLCRYDLPCLYPYKPPYLLVRSDGHGSISDSQALKSTKELCAHAANLVRANPGVPCLFDLCTWLKERIEDDTRAQKAAVPKGVAESKPRPKKEAATKKNAAVEAFVEKKFDSDHYSKMAANTNARLSKAETLEKQLAEAREKAIEAGRIAREKADAEQAREEAAKARAVKSAGGKAAGKGGAQGKGHRQPGLSIVKSAGEGDGSPLGSVGDGGSSASEAETEEDMLVKDIEKILTTKAVGGVAASASAKKSGSDAQQQQQQQQRGNGGQQAGFSLADLSKSAASKAKIDTSVTEPRKSDAELRRQQADSQQMARVMEQNLRGNAAYIKMQESRSKLPAYCMGEEILDAINRHSVVVISGDTGCGKTTQLPQLVLDDAIRRGKGGEVEMICTQPRRISAMSVAERVASERAEKVGQTVGYQIRLEAKRSAQTKLLFCTTGVLLRRLQGDCLLKGVSHIFVDEIHERDINSDFLLIILKQLLPFRPSLKVILMSATLNAPMFADYFGECPCVSIPGRAHPVQALYLEDAFEHTGYVLEKGSEYAKKEDKNSGGGGGKGGGGFGGGGGGGGRNHFGMVKEQMQFESAMKSEEAEALEIKEKIPGYSKNTYMSLSRFSEEMVNYEIIVQLVEHICFTKGEGAILIFMSGLAEITKLYEELTDEYSPLGMDARIKIYPLHSTLSTAEQKAIFDPPPAGCRKVVIATNIAETSITIDDVVYVIDTCKMKENKWNAVSKMSSLTEDWVSQASGRQRRGRAGRVKPGICYHLVPSYKFNAFAEYQVPEMLRVPLDGLILQIKTLNMGDAAGVLGKAIEAPGDSAIGSSMELLRQIGALDEANDDCLTPLGFHLATLPVDVRIGKMLIYGAIFGCIEPVLTMAAAMGFRSPFFSPIDKREEADKARKALGVAHSDHLTTLKAMDGWVAAKKVGRREASSFCQDNFLSRQTLEMISEMRDQFRQLLASIGFVADKYGNNKFDSTPKPEPVVGAVVRAKFYGDGKYYQGTIVDAVQGGGWAVVFQGFEEDGPQATWPKDITVMSCNKCGDAGHMAVNCPLKSAVKKVDESNRNADNIPLLKAVITAGLYPNIIVVDTSKKVPKLNTRSGEVFMHPACLDATNEANLDSKMLVYHEMVKTAKVYIRDATTISPYALLLFGGAIKVQHRLGKITVDGWLGLDAAPKTAVLVKQLREHLDRMLLRKIDAPSEAMSDLDQRVVSSIALLLETEPAPPAGNTPGGEGGGAAAAGASAIKPGDWPCPNCGKNVFASKNSCFSCGYRKMGNFY